LKAPEVEPIGQDWAAAAQPVHYTGKRLRRGDLEPIRLGKAGRVSQSPQDPGPEERVFPAALSNLSVVR
jgi:hypothetical protein